VALRFGPDAKDIRATILALTMALFCAVSVFAKLFPNEVCGPEVDACGDTLTGLIEEQI
jgi:hypothetical protein